ncbi:VanZ family protein [Pseudomonas fluorescens]|uniref:VanZ family protein n=1 Tax=Pseudomonas fluorescens TaxID=294 RepID=UPI002966D7C7|nr:VanZ family protein [Pseudomonas fluorescens]
MAEHVLTAVIHCALQLSLVTPNYFIQAISETSGLGEIYHFFDMSLILIAAGLRPQPIPQFFVEKEKPHHLLGFAILSLSCRLAFPKIELIWIVLGCLLAGIFIEGAQGLMPRRTASVYDMLANSLGVLVGSCRRDRQTMPDISPTAKTDH